MSKYLYNGWELPELPEWDKTTYPYVFICANDYYIVGELILYVCSFKVKYKHVYDFTGNFLGYSLYAQSDGYKVRYHLSSDESEWVIDERYNDGEPDHETEGIWVEGSSDDPYFLKWANYNIYYTDSSSNGDLAGTLYLAASDPVPVGGETEPETPAPVDCYLPMGGAWVKQDTYTTNDAWVKQDEYLFAKSTKEPIAYLYNGTQLLPLPEWDKTTYPYALIRKCANSEANGEYRVYVTTRETYIRSATTIAGLTRIDLYYGYPYMLLVYTSEVGKWHYESVIDGIKYEWELVESGTSGYFKLSLDGEASGDEIVWSNHDILNEDGSVYLAASEPVPVYE